MEIPVKKNETYIVDIIDQGCEGEGIAKIEGYTIFIPETIKEERCKVLILKTTKSHAFGKVLEIIKTSKDRVETECSTYQKCGGCSLRHMNYEATLNLKREIVQNLVDKTLENKLEVKPTIGMEDPYHYRNKAQYPIGYDKQGNITTGVFANRTHDIIPMQECKIQHPISEYIAKLVVKFLRENNISAYQEETNQGVFRHVVIKIGKKTKEVMCVFVVNQKEIPKERELVDYVLQSFKGAYPEYILKTIVKNINTKNTNVILGNENIVLYGDGYIYDKLGEYTFKISPMSFYQVNPVQTEILYSEAIKGANIQKEDIVLDLYCGIGTIGIYASKFAKQVYGIEIIEQAIEDAKENAKENHVENIEFICGDVEQALADLLDNKKVQPNVILVDPPRRGLDNTTIQNILKVQPQKVVYISCNPATMVRDLKQLEEKYEIKGMQPVDMFPFTSHVECCSVLYLKDSIQ
ncbi:MAG: 23S rRNA (uracil(1939)-C(5))-methyltransferase RlmD [Clostridia bacterium]|nr:23S rRNA (uracil(1939)-C(5))-methyltransferase RlmD [Clostridia bacterium]